MKDFVLMPNLTVTTKISQRKYCIYCFLDDHCYWADPSLKAEARKPAVFPRSRAGPSTSRTTAAWTGNFRRLADGRIPGTKFAVEASGRGREGGRSRTGFLRPLGSEGVERVSKPEKFDLKRFIRQKSSPLREKKFLRDYFFKGLQFVDWLLLLYDMVVKLHFGDKKAKQIFKPFKLLCVIVNFPLR